MALAVFGQRVAFHDAVIEHAEVDGAAQAGVEEAADGARGRRPRHSQPRAAATEVHSVAGDAVGVDFLLGHT